MKWSIDRKINTGFGLAVSVLIVIGIVSSLSIYRLLDTIHLLTDSHAVIDTLEDLYSHLKDAQRGERGFVLTGEERYLDPYHSALSLIDDELAELGRLIGSDGTQRSRLASVESGVRENLAELEEAIALRRTRGFDAAVRAIRSGEGKHRMDSIGKIIVEMQAREEARLRGRSEMADARARAAIVTIGSGGLTAIALVLFAIFLINRDITERKRAEQALQQAHDVLETEVQARTAALATTNAELNAEVRERERSEARLALTLEQIERSRDELQFIFDQLRLGTVIVDSSGRISFLSRSMRSFSRRAKSAVGRSWDEVLPIGHEGKAALKAMAELPGERRTRVPVGIEARDGRLYRMEIEILDDPRTNGGKIFSVYDVSEIYDLRSLLGGTGQFENMIGKSSAMRRVFQQIQDMANVDSTTLIEGETGTGKELVANALHSVSHRKDGPFMAVNCAGLTDSLLASQLFGHKRGAFTGAVGDQKGLFEAAQGGTLFLDEIGDISMAVQTGLLRVLQEKEITRLGETRPVRVDVRIIAATHRDLHVEVAEGRFRADLLYRIRVARIELPPLRARREDIPVLAASFLRQSRAATSKPVQDISDDVMRVLMDYAWPGNVRELRSAIEFAVIRCKGEMLKVDDLPPEIRLAQLRSPAEGQPIEQAIEGIAADEGQRILAALRQSGGNRAAAARLLGIGRTTLYRRLESLTADRSMISGQPP